LKYSLFYRQTRREQIIKEELAEVNLGIDYGFFNNRITGQSTTDKESTDLLADIAVPDGANLRNRFFNVGSVRTKGVEFSIESDIVKMRI
jgi:iron complex outermembrane receptor protein